MGLFLASKLTRLALGAAQTALAAGEAYRTGKKIEKRVREALRPQKEDVITMKKSTFAAILVFFAAIAGALTAAYMYLRRREAELERFVEQAGYHYPVVELPYDPQEFYTAVKGLENEPEKGARCTVCYRLRLEQAARYAADHGFDWYCTTLSISPMKDPVRLNELGTELGRQYGVPFLPSEFRKKDGYKRSLQLSAEYGLYRQDYCGCVFSKREREKQNS